MVAVPGLEERRLQKRTGRLGQVPAAELRWSICGSTRMARSTSWTQSSQIGQVLYHGRDGHATNNCTPCRPPWAAILPSLVGPLSLVRQRGDEFGRYAIPSPCRGFMSAGNAQSL